MHSEFATPQSITNFDLLDFVLVDGDSSALPWCPSMRKLALLTKMCMMTGKCVFASGIGAGLLAYVCSTGGERFRVMNNEGRGSLLDDIQAIPPPPPSLASQQLPQYPQPPFNSCDVLLDTKSGDFFVYGSKERCWIPKGNTGLVSHSSDHARDYGAKTNSARAGTKPAAHHRGSGSELSRQLYLSKRGETKCCIRLELASHALFTGCSHREFLVNCKSKWDLDEVIAATGSNRYRVLLDSSRGPMLIEFGNCIGSHFSISKEYPESVRLLRNFVLAKYEELKVHAHIDRSYVSAISGSSRLKDRLHQAQTKSVLHSSSSTSSSKVSTAGGPPNSDHLANKSTTDGHFATSGRTSPKRCRPVSAGPSRTTSKVTHPIRTIKSSRSAYPSASIGPSGEDTTGKDVRIEDARHEETIRRITTASLFSKLAFTSLPEDNNTSNSNRVEPHSQRHNKADDSGGDRPEVDTSTSTNQKLEAAKPQQHHHSSPSQRQHRRVRVPQKNELEKPYCAISKFNKMREEEKQHFYSVVNDAPYVSAGERELLESQKSKLKWTAGPFRTAIGRATTHDVPRETGVFASAPFIQKNAPFYIIQRRELELRDDQHHKPAASVHQHPAPPRQHQRPKTANYKR